MLPIIALVGRPNVGKSTLFNRITQSQNALVANFPGLTRDRQYGEAEHDNKHFLIVDTGGVGVEDQAVDSLMSSQSTTAIKEADLIWFVVDARDGLIGLDSAIMTNLRKHSKPVSLIINKIDGLNESEVGLEFSSLGIPESSTFHISASHGRGIHDLLDKTVVSFSEDDLTNNEENDDNTIRVAFIGRPNVGKSTLINRILGEDRVVVYDMPGTTRDSISVPFERDDTAYTLIDTAGIRCRGKINETVEKFSVVKTLQAIKQANVCLLLFDAQEGLTDQDLHLLGEIIEAGRGLIIVANKWDGLDEEHKDHIKNELTRRLRFVKYAPIRFISALHGSGVGNLYADINAAYQAAHQKFSTPRLTRILLEAVSSHPPPSIQGRRIKLRFAHAGGHNPPIIVIHGNQVNALPDSYKRYLTNTFINELGLVGTPLKLEFKSGSNPFHGKKNKLTDRQVKRKKRLMKFVKKKK